MFCCSVGLDPLPTVPQGARGTKISQVFWLNMSCPIRSFTCSWANLRALQRLVAKEEMVLDVNVRERHVNGIRTLQLETLGAGAIECFDKVIV